MNPNPAEDVRGAIALTQLLLQANPHDLAEWSVRAASVIEATWPASSMAQSTSDALFAVTLLATFLADEVARLESSNPDPSRGEVAAMLARLSARLDDDGAS